MRTFETDVQLLKYRVLKAVAKRAYEGTLMESYYEIPKLISPGPKPTMRCCVYKERAIVQERVRLAMGGDRRNPNIIEVIEIACDECPVERYMVSESCRGCISQRCIKTCPKQAISKKNGKAHIDFDLCIECGRCAKVCPYGAITEHVRPCERSCKVGAIHMNEEKKAEINPEKCISCGACSYACPFGAIMDKSFMVDAINIIRNKKENYKTVAIVAPAIAAQFDGVTLGQVATAIRQLGFDYVVEAAIGADMVADKEAEELVEKGFLTSSCCPAFVDYIKKHVPELADKISHNLSPMAEIGKFVKLGGESPVKCIFIGPCTAKKAEMRLPNVDLWIDSVLTFEELQAMIDAREIEMESLEETSMNDASYFGRIFGRSGGLTEAVLEVIKEKGLDFEVKAEACDGIEACKAALLKAKFGKLDKNFIEGMACVGGCVGGAASLNHEPKSRMKVDKYGKDSDKENVRQAIDTYKVGV
ncbi:4Fe-4S dicluster domain-containing protein [Butyricicoccus pullicaecorum]|uniref:[FeFe] hydrogenase, group B1/B3 n=1 Tax=Butyricicoccus pullicaecorum 1.2 TaxID=1203606 RepID=R8W0Q2_9FIRM|nr:4Fe-4S dicluster domain-containing protein [Butyricicoccus pullicaecorum]EOQ38408.1 [FeFe] hydrogenase, group B1/B3 [Butyricicoccus pullicaecorum 1.2]SKA53929.1 [FeFe] hydrogenase, group B1/B3 [Butyricicoccus pullicaecorum DSM 23266]